VALKETNRTAFIALLQSNLEDVLPLVYTPTIAEACLTWGSLVPRPLGLYVTPDDDPLTLLQHWPSDEVWRVSEGVRRRALMLGARPRPSAARGTHRHPCGRLRSRPAVHVTVAPPHAAGRWPSP
jgi:hypothetical protein